MIPVGLVMRLLPGVALFAAGAIAAETFERVSPWGLETRRARLEKLIIAPVTGYRAKLAAITADRDREKTGREACEAKRIEDRNAAAGEVAKESTAADASRSTAYNAGYTAGRAAGRRSCPGGSNAPPNPALPVPGDPGQPAGVRDADLAGSWGAGAYSPR